MKAAARLAAALRRRLAAQSSQTIPALRRTRRGFSGMLAGAAPRILIEAAHRLSQAPGRGCRFVAYELVQHHPTAPGRLNQRHLERFGRGMASWEAVDCFAVYLAGPAWRTGRVSDAAIHAWARSPDRWWRRAALVSTVPLNLRAHTDGAGDAPRTLRVCSLLLDDRDPMVVKALSWALRALATRDARAVRAFLSGHSGRLAALVRREVRNKLTTGLKNPRR